ncbi:Phytochrome-like protein cph2 [bacterium HR19]|nr:Phytochrome-like protein cph2 [bacterium HR19]
MSYNIKNPLKIFFSLSQEEKDKIKSFLKKFFQEVLEVENPEKSDFILTSTENLTDVELKGKGKIVLYKNLSPEEMIELGKKGVIDFIKMDEIQKLPFIIEREIRKTAQDKFNKFYINWLKKHDIETDFLKESEFIALANSRLKENPLSPFALFIIQINFFDLLVVHLGRNVVYEIIDIIAEKTREITSEEDILGRITERKFAVLKPIQSVKDADEFAKELINRFSKSTQQRQIKASISIGISIFPQDGLSISELFQKAENSAGKIERKGSSEYIFYSDIQQKEGQNFFKDIFVALKEKRFSIVYQPIFDIKTKKITMFEALLRSKDRIINPEIIIKTAEITGTIYELTKFIFENVFETAKRLEKFPFSINISPKHLLIPEICEELKNIFKKFDLGKEKIYLEISEKSSFEELTEGKRVIQELKNLGIGISIDDFGAGQSSIALLKEVPSEIVKIDISMLKGLEEDDFSKYLVESLIFLCKNTQKKIVAEGVETERELKIIEILDFDMGQGFFLSPPLHPEEIYGV